MPKIFISREFKVIKEFREFSSKLSSLNSLYSLNSLKKLFNKSNSLAVYQIARCAHLLHDIETVT